MSLVVAATVPLQLLCSLDVVSTSQLATVVSLVAVVVVMRVVPPVPTMSLVVAATVPL